MPSSISRLLAVGATFSLHLLLLQAGSLGSSTKRSAPEQIGPGASSVLSSDGVWMSVVIVYLPGVDGSITENIASRGASDLSPTIQIVSPDATPSFEIPAPELLDESGEAAMTAGDPAVQSMLFGRYTGQIDARIQRAWRKPRTPIQGEPSATAEASVFRCQARIKQDESGVVKEVELFACNGSPEWQLSLVRAIQRSSPLPAPPNPTVFTNVLTMSFEGHEYTAGQREEEYEPNAARAAL